MWVDLGLVNLVDAVMNGPQTLYDMPEGSFLASIRFNDDPDSVPCDSVPRFGGTNEIETPNGIYIGTEKSFGWRGFAWAGENSGDGTVAQVRDYANITQALYGYGPFAATDSGNPYDVISLVLSAAVVGPIQIGLGVIDGTVGIEGSGAGVRVAAITPWSATTTYDSPASNTVATPGVLQKCAILENDTIWINDGLTGTSGGSAPDFAGNAGGSVTDGPDIVWYDTTSPPPTVGAVHVFAEIIMPVVSASPGSIYASVVKKGSVTVAVKNKGNIVANVIQ